MLAFPLTSSGTIKHYTHCGRVNEAMNDDDDGWIILSLDIQVTRCLPSYLCADRRREEKMMPILYVLQKQDDHVVCSSQSIVSAFLSLQLDFKQQIIMKQWKYRPESIQPTSE